VVAAGVVVGAPEDGVAVAEDAAASGGSGAIVMDAPGTRAVVLGVSEVAVGACEEVEDVEVDDAFASAVFAWCPRTDSAAKIRHAIASPEAITKPTRMIPAWTRRRGTNRPPEL
jgi:hypothetical protein